MNIIDQLQQLGLNFRQSKIYLALLQLGSAGAIEIAKYTKYKHPTVYDALDSLKEKRLITESILKGRKVFTAEDPEMLLRLEEERQRALNTMMPELRELYLGGSHRTRIRCFEGNEGVLTIRNELLNTRAKEYYYFGSVAEMLRQTSSEEEKEYVQERVKRGIRSYAIRDRSKEVNLDFMNPGEQNMRTVRYLPKPMPDNVSGLYIYDDKIAIGSALKENYSLIIESRELSILMKTLWEYIWEISEEP